MNSAFLIGAATAAHQVEGNNDHSDIWAMEHMVYGHAGKVMFAFPPQSGHTHDFANFGMVETVRPWIDAGKLRVVCVDAIDEDD